MRKLFATVMTLAGLLAVSAPLSAQTATKIGYIDTRRVLQEAPGAQEARTTLESEMQGFQNQLQMMQDSLQAMMTDYQQKSLVMSADAKQKREQEIIAKRTGWEQRAEQLQQQAAQRQQQVMEPIMQRVEAAISEVRQTQGYAIIFDVVSEAIVSADPALDITATVIERLKAGAPAASGQQ
ncbi:MAG TPA: OmpH family outer membrane protein [Longimicrobiales bacterium]|nr:OmpH family outer membrane protein [Longimicrobiales bacterium]